MGVGYHRPWSTVINMKLVNRLRLASLVVGAMVTCWVTISTVGRRQTTQTTAAHYSAKEEAARNSCRPARHVVFLKTHKAGSSTVFNILVRYAAEEGLVLALPRSPTLFQHYPPLPFDPDKLLDLSAAGMSPNLVAMHMRFDREALMSLMPKSTRFVTIMREPVDLFRSLYDYYLLERFYHNASLEEFVFNDEHVSALKKNRFSQTLGFNQMAFDLGLDPMDFDNHNKVSKLISLVESTFDVVMVAERFSESLVLLRHALCLPSLQNVVAFRKNAMADPARTLMTTRVAGRVSELNAADVEIYRHFARRLDMQIAQLGRERVAAEAAQVEALTRQWLAGCGVEETTRHRYVVHVIPGDMEHNETCRRLALSELDFTRELRWLQTRLARQRTGMFYE